MKLKKFGFFDTGSLDERKQLLKQLRGTQEHEAKKKIASYLRNGAELMMAAGITRDPLNEKHQIVGAPHVLTDGAWAWTADVVYYLEKYNIRLPEELIENMKQNEWTIPQGVDLRSLELEL